MRPKVSSGYLTPQLKRKKPAARPRRAESSENVLKMTMNEDIFKKLMSCPIKKQLVIDLITSEKDNIEAYKKELKKQNDKSKLCRYESPTALMRRRLKERNNSGTESNTDNDSNCERRTESRQSIISTVPSPVNFDKILDGVIAFVEVRSGDRDRSAGVKTMLTSMGASVRDTFKKDITHVVFKDGQYSTYQKAKLINAKLISVLWLEACKSAGMKVQEKDYPAISAVGASAYSHNETIFCSQLQKEYEDIVREELNNSVARGKPPPPINSVLDRNVSSLHFSKCILFPNGQEEDAQDFEVANIMFNSTHDFPFNDTGPIIDGDIEDNCDNKSEYITTNQKLQKTSTIPEDMDLTDLEKGSESTSSRNKLLNESFNRYDQKTPKINAITANTPVNHNESPNLTEGMLYKRRTKLFENRNSPIISKMSQTILSENSRNKQSSKSEMSSLCISDTSVKNKNKLDTSNSLNSFISIQSDVNDIIQLLEDSSENLATPNNNKKSLKKNPFAKENTVLETPKTDLYLLLKNNVTLRKRYQNNNDLNIEILPDNSEGINRNRKSKQVTNKMVKTKDLLETRTNRRKTVAGTSVEIVPKKKLNLSLSEEKDNKETFKRINDVNELSEADVINKETTKVINNSSTTTESNKKVPTPKTKSPAIQNAPISKSDNEEPNIESRPEKTRRQTIASMNKSKLNYSTKSNNLRKRSLSITNEVTENCHNTNKIKKLRKLYTHDDDPNPINNDECERENKRRARKSSDLRVFIKPTIILSDKDKQYMKQNKINIEDILNPSSGKSAPKATKKGKNVKPDDSTDEQTELKNCILNKRKNVQEEEQVTESKSKMNNKVKHSKTVQPTMITRATPKTPRNTTGPKPKITSIIPITNRRSSIEFQSEALSSAKKRLKIDKFEVPSIVCTKMHKEDVQVFSQIVKKLGKFNVEDEVSKKTTHLIAGEPKRTINMLRAMAMGCWILKKEWLFRSLESGKWLPEEDFEETGFSSVVQKNRLQREAFGPSYTMDTFRECGPIYISRSTTPRCSDLQELVSLCKGNVTRLVKNARIVIGEYVKVECVTCITETWVLDCMTKNKLLPFKKYLISNRKSSIV